MYDLFWSDASYRSKFTRHMGGANYGFADGHASWMNAEQVMSLANGRICCSPQSNYTGCTKQDGKLMGMCCCLWG